MAEYNPSPLVNDVETGPDVGLAHRVDTACSNPDVMDRLQELTRVLSTRTLADGEFTINPDDFDLESVLRSLRSRANKVGLESNSSGVAFRNLTATGIDVSATYGPSVLELFRSIASIPGKLFSRKAPKIKKIIRNVNGVVQQGEMLFVIGRPGSGCSTFLKCIAGETAGLLGVEGDFSYDGLSQPEMLKNYKGYVIYNPELDFHFPHLTVAQTLDFAIATRTPALRYDGLSRQQYIANQREILATIFGLRHAFNTKVGNDFVRGVSGGERKRVSIAEAMAADASIYAWDNATRGLDASTALEFAHAIRSTTNLSKNASLIAIYQAGENIFNVFDKVTVLYLGRQVYFGPATLAKDYFINMGWECPSRMTSAEFLTSVTDPNGRTPRQGYEHRVPKTADEFEAYWHNSPEFQQCIAEYDQYLLQHDKSQTQARLREATDQRQMKRQKASSFYLLTYSSQVKHLIVRGFQRVKGDITFTYINMAAFVIQALVVGSLFYDISPTTAGAYSRGGTLFFALLFMALSTLAEVSNSFDQRPIIIKQKSYSMYHPSAEAFQLVFSEFPKKFASVALFAIVLYFLTGLKVTAGAFFTFFLFLMLAVMVMSALFQSIASISPNVGVANSIAGMGVLILSIYTGYMITLPKMHPWFKWLSYLNPLRWAYEAVIANEFLGKKMGCVTMIPSGPGYAGVSIANQVCSFLGSQPGQPFVTGPDYIHLNYHYSYSHVWRNLGFVLAYLVFFICVNLLASEFVSPDSAAGDVLLFKRGSLPEGDAELLEAGIPSVEEMKVILNGSTEKVDFSKKEIFSWKHVDYTIPLDGGTRKLLDDVQGFVKPGTMTALMGESGAGKTTLLNVLSQRISFGVITGDMFVNGKDIDSSFQRRTGYVQQQDLHLAESSVREALRFSAELRQPKEVPIAEKHEYVEKIITLLGMQDYAESLVGSVGKGLNVEQRKKLSIGTELVAKPALLLFLDEPTSGLDSQSAWSIVQFLRSLADSGQAILCTIHQPSATLFEIFDRLLLLKKGGKTVYFGDVGPSSSTLLGYFERQSGVKCNADHNPAEFILECIGAGATAKNTADWNELWLESPEYAAVSQEVDNLNRELKALPPVTAEGKNLAGKFATDYLTQLKIVFRRTGNQFWRRPDYLMAKFMLIIVGSLFIGFTFWNIDATIAGTQNAIFAVFIILVLCVPLINQIQSFAFDTRELFEVRESASNTFHWSCLLLAQAGWEAIYSVLAGCLSFLCYYWTVGYSSDANLAGYFFLIQSVMWPLYYTSFGLWVIYFAPDVPSAAIITSFLFTFMISFCGVLQPAANMVGFWTFMYKVSPMTYFIQSLLGTAVHGKQIICAEVEYNIFYPPSGQTCQQFAGTFIKNFGGYLADDSAMDECKYCAYTLGDQVIKGFGVEYSQRWRNFGFMFVYLCFNIAAMLGCYYLTRVKVWGKVDFAAMFGKKKKAAEPAPSQLTNNSTDDDENKV
ncbi:hypothetical protein NADFUDRAFT_84369 [Nadsonia fulvescens var. elongata DSM 6958]|uniref:ABC transporter domain-containing protein n=1 Tax=Nadsonia fulvescens var. elongata DSM 6958 TaxID=857566 RepID=A0A1E3PD79_9ASCO|nr:hypothetical protein NADFUDRAFT_84369 [Nadsonia fulvescens var. elongata DSM 6958]